MSGGCYSCWGAGPLPAQLRGGGDEDYLADLRPGGIIFGQGSRACSGGPHGPARCYPTRVARQNAMGHRGLHVLVEVEPCTTSSKVLSAGLSSVQ